MLAKDFYTSNTGARRKKEVWDTIKPPIFSILSSGNFENPELLKKQAIYKITR